MAQNANWTKADDQTFRELWADGASLQDIADELDRTYDSVAVRRGRLGLPKRNEAWTPEDDAVLEKLWAKGASLRTIAEALGRTQNAVGVRRFTLGLPARRKQRRRRDIGIRRRAWTDADDARLRQRWDEGASIRRIAEELDRTDFAVASRRRALDLPKRAAFGRGT